mmetsp:Transcript_44478/g.123064  ORF Transcript_44478/g.123064 Transcript_44478/m.123064 type:complete len:240 (-) Transcript_44478:192-911(-)|eukprot:CAMPEP_0117473370 /NCGR_PEP_ID=MMETSP0784-20121206/8738_1 /TAXON_ID=39447 /ORGANISM="" /LENGTH=239 /DNA_ID=CAMNT_0005267571 /DNA_START=74 /DNA_END=793 /DNA_ORIENTATION=+
MDRVCAEPHRLFEVLQATSVQDLSDGTKAVARHVGIGARWCTDVASQHIGDAASRCSDSARRLLGPQWQAAGPAKDAGLTPKCGGVNISRGSEPFDPVQRRAVAPPTFRGVQLEKGTLDVKKYLFSDEGKEKGVVKVYIKAEELDMGAGGIGGAFSEATVEFRERALHVRAVSADGRVWVLHIGLFSAVLPDECKYSLSSSGHKVSITLKKADAATTWSRLSERVGSDPRALHHESDFL